MGGHGHSPEAAPQKNQDLKSLSDHRVPVAFRDNCAHLLVKLNSCRRETFFDPGQCTHQRHIYEECEYIAWSARTEQKKNMASA